MAMPLAYAVPGAEVEKVLDFVSVKETETGPVYKWKPSNPKRRGFIVKTKYPNDDTYSSDCVEYVLVKFEQGKDPEKCIPAQLNLIKVANEAAMAAIKNEVAIAKANNGLIDDMKKPLVTDQTGRGKSGSGMSRAEAEEFAKK